MPKNVLRNLSIVLGVLFLYGCTATKDIKVRRYVEVKDRVDQSMEEGNAGFLSGTPQPEDRSGIKKTRKTYVLEVSKDAVLEETGEVAVESDDAVTAEPVYEEEDSGDGSDELTATEDTMVTSDEEEDTDEAVEPAPSFVEYKVQKDDTLQKISKEFYDSYSQWPKIYEINKDVIGNPDRIKPGIVIQIPIE